MSRGVLIFAFNNSKINYYKQAVWLAGRIKHFLGLPTTIVTTYKDSISYFDDDILHSTIIADAESLSNRNFDISKKGFTDKWYNANRYQAYDESLYDETIVIDSDYIVNSPQLNLLFESPHDFLCHRHAYDIANKNSLVEYQTFGATKFPHYWATVLFFRKSDFAEQIFEIITMVKENYAHYGKLYKFSTTPFRNDFAVSIALSIMYGHRINSIPSIPWNLPTAVTDINVIQKDYDTFNLEYTKQREMYSEIKGQDFHCLNKIALEKLIDA